MPEKQNVVEIPVDEQQVLTPEAIAEEKRMQNEIRNVVVNHAEDLYPECKLIVDFLQNIKKPGTGFFNRKLNLKTELTLSDVLYAASSLYQKVNHVLKSNALEDSYAHNIVYQEIFRFFYSLTGPMQINRPGQSDANLLVRVRVLMSTAASGDGVVIDQSLAKLKEAKADMKDDLSNHMVLYVSALESVVSKLHAAVSQISENDSQIVESRLSPEEGKLRANLQMVSKHLAEKNECYAKKMNVLMAIPEPEVGLDNAVDKSAFKGLQALISLYNYHQYLISNIKPTNEQLHVSLKYLNQISKACDNSYDLSSKVQEAMSDKIKKFKLEITNELESRAKEFSVTRTESAANSSPSQTPDPSRTNSRRPSKET